MTTAATIRYLNEKYKGQTEVSYTIETSKELTVKYDVELRDGRELPNDGLDQLQERGFTLVPFLSAAHADLGTIENPDHYKTPDQLAVPETAVGRRTRETYFAECESLVKEVTGAPHCFTIGHAVRKGNDNTSGVGYLTAYATFAHCDYTVAIANGAPKMLAKRMGISLEEAEEMDVAFYNIWQSTNHTVVQHPLALLDYNTVETTDVMGVELGYAVTPESDRSKQRRAPQIAQLTHREGHRWYFYPQLQQDEALLFKQVDIRDGCQCFHTAFVDPNAPMDGATPRHNVEVRVLAAWPKQGGWSGTVSLTEAKL